MDRVKNDQENVWKIVKQRRKTLLSQLKDPKCQSDQPLLYFGYIKNNIDVVEEKLKLNIERDPNKNVSDETLQFAAKLFTYLNYCPTKDFYVLSSVIKSESAKNILLALTSMMKTSQNAGKKSITKIFTKAMEIFKFSIYKDIDEFTKKMGIDNWRNDMKNSDEILEVLGHYDNLKSLFVESVSF